MMTEDNQNNRRSICLRGYDYAQAGGYFVTTCASQRRCVFAKVENNEVRLHPYGKIVEQCWLSLIEHYPQVILDEYMVMPNHFHGILVINSHEGAGSSRPNSLTEGIDIEQKNRAGEPRPYDATLGQMIGYFKYCATKEINDYRITKQLPQVKIWQRNYYEHIIRDENELDEIRRYIMENPLNWAEDTENPELK